jgi:selenide,water dikinase
MRVFTVSGEPIHLVLLGGGHSHLAVLKHFGMTAPPDVRLTLVSRSVVTPYSGMLPGMIAGHYSPEDAHVNLTALARFGRAHTVFDEALGLDLAGRRVLLRELPAVPFDLLSIDIGAAPNLSVPGAMENAVAVKPIDRLVRRWSLLCDRVRRAPERLVLAVVGGGAAGVEVVLAAQARLRALLGRDAGYASRIECHLFTDRDDVLPFHNTRVRRIFRRVLKERGVIVHLRNAVTQVAHGRLQTADGKWHEANEVVWCTEASAVPWVSQSGLAVDHSGFMQVSSSLQSTSHERVFAAGDVASIVGHPRERSAALAVQEGPWLAANLVRAVRGEPLRTYKPARRFLSMISTGNRYAVASYGPFALEGSWVWRWKDRIDRRFTRTYTELPPHTGGSD